MSHPRELLSAFLDGELSPEERLRVEQHLAACAECAAELSEAALVDEWARDAPVSAPAGYFETLPGRVRARLRGKTAARPRRLVPQWAWAAAALLLVGLLIPITFMRRSSQAPVADTALPPQASRPVPAQEPEAAPTPAPGVPAPELARRAGAGPARPAPAPVQAPVAPGGFAPPPAAPPAPLREVTRNEDDDGAGAVKEFGYEAKPDDQEARRSRTETAPEAQDRLQAAAGAAAPATVGPAARADAYRQPALSAKRKAEERAPAPAASAEEFASLAGRSPRSVEQARALRLAWRAFGETHAEDPRADEARVRAIEAAARAYELSGEPADRETFERDAAAYLQRPDALQKARVEALLRATLT